MKYVQDLVKEPTFKRLLNILEGRVSLRTTANFGVLRAGSGSQQSLTRPFTFGICGIILLFPL